MTPLPETLAAEAQLVAASLGFGLFVGVAAGLVLVGALRYGLVVATGYEHIFTLAAVVLLFESVRRNRARERSDGRDSGGRRRRKF